MWSQDDNKHHSVAFCVYAMIARMQEFVIHTDGGARGNPGPSGIGVAVYNSDGEEISSLSEYIGEATNNVAEYTALVQALEHTATLVPDTKALKLTVRLDSQLAERQLNGAYKVKDATLKTYFDTVKTLAEQFASVSYEHVRRDENKRADALANEAMDKGE